MCNGTALIYSADLWFCLWVVLSVITFLIDDVLCLPGLRIKETKEVYEGEVIELTPAETENPMGGGMSFSIVALYS